MHVGAEGYAISVLWYEDNPYTNRPAVKAAAAGVYLTRSKATAELFVQFFRGHGYKAIARERSVRVDGLRALVYAVVVRGTGDLDSPQPQQQQEP